MAEKDVKTAKHTNGAVADPNGVSNAITKQIENRAFLWQENVTIIDLTARNIEILSDKAKLPANLVQLNLSHNKFVEVPSVVLNLEKLAVLNLSHNMIEYFDDNPKFCHTLKLLDMSYNNLSGPPYWIWTELPKNLTQLNLSNNEDITKSFTDGYFEELLQCSTLVTEVNLQNCRISKFTELLATFPKATYLCLGTDDYKLHKANSLLEIPCRGLDQCCDLKRLILCNTHVYTVSPSIEIYKNLVAINLAQNDLNGLPNEFCNLDNLEVCILSLNKILYLPEDIYKLQKLICLYLDSNELCMLPDTLCKLSNLRTLDLYDNNLNEVPNNFVNLEELDLAQNYFDEPEETEYFVMKEKLRLTHKNRYSGRKNIIINCEDDDYSGSESEDDEELYEMFFNGAKPQDPPFDLNPPSSPEDWDSDEYWVPCYMHNIPNAPSPWLCFVKQKMKEGNFCPMDAHPISVVEKVRYEKLCNPQVNHESDGQFDDYSSDDT